MDLSRRDFLNLSAGAGTGAALEGIAELRLASTVGPDTDDGRRVGREM